MRARHALREYLAQSCVSYDSLICAMIFLSLSFYVLSLWIAQQPPYEQDPLSQAKSHLFIPQ